MNLSLVALVLFGDVLTWSGQVHFEDTSGTRPGHVWDVSGTCPDRDTFLGNFGQGHGTSLRN